MLRKWESHLLQWICPIDLLGIFPLLGLQSRVDRYIFSSVYLLLVSGSLDIIQGCLTPLDKESCVRNHAICDMKYIFTGILVGYIKQR